MSLFGCINGWIPYLMLQKAPPQQSEPYAWDTPILAGLSADGHPNSALLIDLKPNEAQPNLSIYELVRVWGYSADGWTPIMLQLRALFIDDDPSKHDRNSFSLPSSRAPEPIFSFLYLKGTINEGKLSGKWIAPPASPTNSVLLWPEPLDHFMGAIQAVRGVA